MPGTIGDYDGFDVQQDCELLRKAMKGLGTDEAQIIAVVAHRSNAQRQELKKMYAQMWGRELLPDIKAELGGHFEDATLALFKKPRDFDAWCLHDAMSGAGTTESTLIEIMSSRSNDEIKEVIKQYKLLHKGDLAKALQGETSGHFKRLLFSLAQASRDDEVDADKAAVDAQGLFDAGEKSWGTDESRFNVVLASRSFGQLELIMKEYEKLSKKTVEEAVKSELSGDLEDGMLAILKCAKDKPTFFAERLYKSMKGAGTNDKALIRLVVSRSEVDLVEIKAAFEAKYGQTLEQFVEADISGDYKKLMLEVVKGNQ